LWNEQTRQNTLVIQINEGLVGHGKTPINQPSVLAEVAKDVNKTLDDASIVEQDRLTLGDIPSLHQDAENAIQNDPFLEVTSDLSRMARVWLLYAAKEYVNCFPGGTLVGTEHGLKAIETISRQDRVWGFDFTKRQWRLCQVDNTFQFWYDRPIVTILTEEDEVQSTSNHPLWVVRGEALAKRPAPAHVQAYEEGNSLDGRWVDAADLRVGDELYLRSEATTTVRGLANRTEPMTVYNLQVRELHTYAVGKSQLLVHNRLGDDPDFPPDKITQKQIDDLTPEERVQLAREYQERADNLEQMLKEAQGRGNLEEIDDLQKQIAALRILIPNLFK
jgi:hypothetical protein